MLYLFKILEKEINLLYESKNNAQLKKAQKIIDKFQGRRVVCGFIFSLIEFSSNLRLIYFGLYILEKKYICNWCNISQEKKNKIKNFIISMIFKLIFNSSKNKENSIILVKLNLILVKLTKFSKNSFLIFIKDLVQSSSISEYICENNLNILALLFDEIFLHLNSYYYFLFEKNNLHFFKILKEIEFLCYSILLQDKLIIVKKKKLISCTLTTFQKIIKIFPPNYNIEAVFLRSFSILSIKNDLKIFFLTSLKELLNFPSILSTSLVFKIIKFFMIQFQEIYPVSENMLPISSKVAEKMKIFTTNAVLLLLILLKNWSKLFYENISLHGFLLLINQFILKIFCISSFETFNICLNWWIILMKKIRKKNSYKTLNLQNLKFFIELETVIINRIIKPEEILATKNVVGSIDKKKNSSTHLHRIYLKQKKILSYLAKLNKNIFKSVISEKLNFQFNKKLWNAKEFNSLCWAIGSVSKIFDSKIGRNFIKNIIENLLYLIEIKSKNKATIASNLMYIVGQYVYFLKKHSRFLKIIILKLFEFMQENYPGIKEMACDVFLKIGKFCAGSIFNLQNEDRSPFIDNILNSIDTIANQLNESQVKQVYEALAFIINQTNIPECSNSYISRIFEIINKIWFNRLKKNLANGSINLFNEVAKLLQINKTIASHLKKNYQFYIKILYFEMHCFCKISFVKLYNLFYSKKTATVFLSIRYLVNFIDEMLLLTKNYIKILLDSNDGMNCWNISVAILAVVGSDKISLVLKTRSSGIIRFCIFILNKCKKYIRNEIIEKILQNIFIPSISSLEKNFTNFRDTKLFFYLIKTLIDVYFSSFLAFGKKYKHTERMLEIIVQIILRGFGHPNEIFSKSSLRVLLVLLKRINNTKIKGYFYSKFAQKLLVKLLCTSVCKIHFSDLKIESILIFYTTICAKKFINLEEQIEVIYDKIFQNSNKNIKKNFYAIFSDYKFYFEFEHKFKRLIKVTKSELNYNQTSLKFDNKTTTQELGNSI